MDIEIAISLTAFAIATLFLPGPNNLLLLASSAQFGWRSTVPHILGAVFGATALMALSVLGVSELVLKAPIILTVVKFGGAAWLFWFGLRYIFSARASRKMDSVREVSHTSPISFGQAAIFQWVNPSALIFTVAIAGAFADIAESAFLRCISICTIFASVAILATITWTTLGNNLARLFTSHTSGPWAQGAMGTLILLIAIRLSTI